MGHHIDDEGRFQSDKYSELPPDKIILSFKDPAARHALGEYAEYVFAHGGDKELAEDITARLESWKEEDGSES